MKTNKNHEPLSDLTQSFGEITAMFAKYYTSRNDKIQPDDKRKKAYVYDIVTSVTLIGYFEYFDKIYNYSAKGSMTRSEALAKSETYRDAIIKVDKYFDSKLFTRSPKLMSSFEFYAKCLEPVADEKSISYKYDTCLAAANDLGEKLLKASKAVNPVIDAVWKLRG